MVAQITSIKKRKDFLEIAKTSLKFPCKSMVLMSLKNENSSEMRLGLTVSKKIGTAVVRNLIKRRLRNACAVIMPLKANSEFSYVIIARQQIVNLSFSEIMRDLNYCFKKIHSCDEAKMSQSQNELPGGEK